MPTYYSKLELIPPDNPTGFRLTRVNGAPPDPPEMIALRRDYEKVSRDISTIFENHPETRVEFLRKIHAGVDLGFIGDGPDIERSRENLDALKDDVENHAYKLRGEWLTKYFKYAIIIFTPTFIIGLGIYLSARYGWIPYFARSQDVYPLEVCVLIAAFWIPAGAAFCVWGEFALRMGSRITYDKLLYMDPDRWDPLHRMIVTIGVAVIFGFLLGIQVFQVGLGGVLLNDFINKSPTLSIAIGGITGLAFPAVRDMIHKTNPEIRRDA